MNPALKQRLTGATLLVALGVIFIPPLLEYDAEDTKDTEEIVIPSAPTMDFPDRLADPPTIVIDPEPPIETAIADVRATTEAELQTVSKLQPAPETNVAPDATAQWVVQVGSFSEKKNALKLQQALEKLGFTSFVETIANGTTFRVRLGPLATRAEAEKLAKKLRQQSQYRGIVMNHIPSEGIAE